MSSIPWLTLATFLPVGFAVLMLPFKNRAAVKGLALLGSLATLVVTSATLWLYRSDTGRETELAAVIGPSHVLPGDLVGRDLVRSALDAAGAADRAVWAMKRGTGENAQSIYEDAQDLDEPSFRALGEAVSGPAGASGPGGPAGELAERFEALRLDAGAAGLVRDALIARAVARAAEARVRQIEDVLARREAVRWYGEMREMDLVLGQDEQGHYRIPVVEHIRFVEYASWIPAFRVHYFLGADGLSLPLIWLTALLTVLCVIYSWNVEKINKTYPKAFYGLFLLLETGLIGVFASLDFFLFYVFWEIVLLPMYFLIGIWGGHDRIYAAIKFFIYTLAGSVLMLVAMLAMYFAAEPATFNMLALQQVVPYMTYGFQWWIFVALFIAFAIKVPVFPFHTWLPAAHVEAPTAGSMVLAGILLKMGGYGFFRILYPLCPEAATSHVFIYFIAILGLINIVYGALVAMAQTDFKKLVAYSSISHMGYVLLGLVAMSAAGFSGAVLQMFNHGLSSAMLFAMVGILYDHWDKKLSHRRPHHRNLAGYRGIGLQMPYYTGWAVLGFFASLGLPGLNGFISEALVFLGAYDQTSILSQIQARWIVYCSLTGIILTAAYILWTIQRVYLGEKDPHQEFDDLKFTEMLTLAPLGLLCVVVGVYPSIILDFMNPTLEAIRRPVMTWFGG